MKKFAETLLVLSLIAVLGACSKKSSTDETFDDTFEDEIAAGDAGTDAVPEDGMENLDAPPDEEGDLAAAPVDSGMSEPMGGDSFTAASGSGEYDNYKVQSGDTLMKIAFEYYGDLYQWRRIYEANQDKVSDPNMIPAGTVLRVEKPATPVVVERNGQPYLVKVGDTLGTISADVYGTPAKWKKIWQNNRQLIKNPNKIYAGFYVYYTMSPEDEAEKMTLGATGGGGMGRAPASAQPMGGAPAAQPMGQPMSGGMGNGAFGGGAGFGQPAGMDGQ